MAKIGVEASEIMGAVAMFMTPKQIENYSKDAIGLMTFLKEGKKIAESDKIVYPSGTKDKFLKAFADPHDKDFLLAAVAGMSASIATRKWVPTRSAQTSRDAVINSDKIPEKVFLTGDSWPKEVQQFLVARDGFDSYNSSDYIIKWTNPKGLSYYGISLKKKKKPKAGDPTLINKAFDTVLQSSNPKELKRLNEIKKEIDEAKVKYFARVVKEASTTNPPGSKTPYLTFTKGQVLPNSPEDVMKIRVNMPGFAKKALPLIDIKGIGKIDLQKSKNQPETEEHKNIFKIKTKYDNDYREFRKGEMLNESLSMRAFVNKKVASKDSVYAAMLPVVNKYADKFANALINLILKIKLYESLDDNKFAFALVTGIGDIAKDGTPIVSPGRLESLHTVLCGLSALQDAGKTKYEMTLDDEANKKSEGAKVFFKLKKGDINIIDLNLRYKGGFTSQPQFQATISDDFKDVLTEQYGKICRQPK